MQTPSVPTAASSDSTDFDDQTIRVSSPESKGENIDRFEFAGEHGEKCGDFIGPYKLLEQIGEGGFGTVWRAEQTKPVHREVAVKLIKAGMDSREIIGRFEAERQALAMMDHPNIARMLDGGTTASGRPYFAMEFVKGAPVNEFCDSRKLSLNDRIGIYIDICSAVQHAHQKAILHRDLKPSNIIVSENGGRIVPKVIDFGVAKALGQQLSDKTMFTAMGLAIGTPQYMSPEQAGATYQDIDTRSDVYSLGVILYELLTGSTPLTRDEVKKLMMHQLMEVLRTKEAERPSTRFQNMDEAARQQIASARHMDFTRLQKHLRGDLDWVVMRALEKDRNRRYQTVNALALDLQRYLGGEAVEAGPPSASYRLGKMAKRYRGPLIAAGLVAASIVAGLGFTVWQAIRATNAEKLAFERLNEAQKARDAAEDLVSEAIYGLRTKLIPVGKVELMNEMVIAADNYYRRLPAELLKDDDTQRHLASLALNRAIIAGASGDDKEHEERTREALDLLETLAAKNPAEEQIHKEICYSMLNLCYVYEDRNDSKSLVQMADQVVARCESWLKKHPKTLWAMHYQVMAHNGAAQAMIRYLNQAQEGARRFTTATEITQKMRESGGETAETCECEGFIHYGNAKAAGSLRMPAVALKEFELSTTSFSRALELGGDSALLREMHVGAMHQYACKLLEQARSAKDSAGMTRAQELLDQSFEGRRKLVELEPRHAEWWRDLAYSYTVQAEVDARDHGDQAAQIRNLREALRCREEAVKNQPNRPLLHHELGLTNSSIASALMLQQKPDTKIVAEHSLRSIEGWRKAVELAGYEVTITYHGIESDVKRLVGLSLTDPSIAVKDLMKACSILEPLAGKPLSGQAKPGYIMNALLQLHRGLQGAYEALGLAKEAKTEADTIAALEGRETTASGILALGQTKYYEAHSAWRKARVLPLDQRDAALAKVEAQRLQANALLEKAFEKESADPKYRDSLANSWRLKGLILQDQNKKREAVVAFDKAVTLYDPVTGLSGIIDTLGDAAGRLDDLKDYKAAVEYSQRAVKLADERCAELGDQASIPVHTRASYYAGAGWRWVRLGWSQIHVMDAQSGTKALNEAVKRMGTAHELEPTDRGFHWDLIRVELDLWKEQLKLKMPVQALESAAPHLPEFAGLMGNENSHDRLWSMLSQIIGPLTGTLRDQKRLPEATTLMRHIIALRQRMEVLEGWPKDMANLSFGARVSLIGLLTEQKLTAEADAERKAMLAEVEKSGSPLVQAEVHARLWSWLNSLGKHDEAEAEARVAHTIALKNNLGWRTMQYASDLGTTLEKEEKREEAEKLLLETWAQTSKQAWPDENVRLRADLANRIAALYHGMHMKQPETARDDAARVWVARAAEQFPLEKISNGYDLDFAAPLWMGWLAQLVDEGKVEEYKKQRSALIGKAKDLMSGTNAERVTKASLLLPLAGDELKLVIEGAANAFQINPNDEWRRLGQCIALLRSGKPRECLETAQPMFKTSDSGRYCCILPVAAIAHRHLGQHSEADAIIATLEKDSYRMKVISSPTSRDAIIARVLLKEARKK